MKIMKTVGEFGIFLCPNSPARYSEPYSPPDSGRKSNPPFFMPDNASSEPCHRKRDITRKGRHPKGMGDAKDN
jgi:hypothetical protein